MPSSNSAAALGSLCSVRRTLLAPAPAGGRSARFQRASAFLGEPVGCLHHQVEDHRPAGQVQLGALPSEFLDRASYLGDRLRAHSMATMQHPVHSGAAQPRLVGDIGDSKLTAGCHEGTLVRLGYSRVTSASGTAGRHHRPMWPLRVETRLSP